MKIGTGSLWVMAGDSITACQRDATANPDDLGQGYVMYVNGFLAACYPDEQIRLLNRGVPGDTARELKARWQADVLGLNPDWLSVCIGINDVWQQFDGKHEGQAHVTLGEYEAILDALLAATRPALKGLLLITPYFIQPRGEPMRAMMDTYGEAVQRLADRYEAICVDAQAAFDRALMTIPEGLIHLDGAHLTGVGHMILAQTILQAVDFDWSKK